MKGSTKLYSLLYKKYKYNKNNIIFFTVPIEGFCGFFNAYIETFHCTILGARDEPHRLSHVKTDFIDRSLVIDENVFLLGS